MLYLLGSYLYVSGLQNILLRCVIGCVNFGLQIGGNAEKANFRASAIKYW